MRKSYVVKRERELVLRSSIIDNDEYGNLRAMLNKYELINDDVIKKDTEFSAETISILKSTFPAIVTNAVSEWVYIGEKIKKSRCILDNRPIETEYYIQNIHTSEKIVVGSECINRFGFGDKAGRSAKTIINKQKREQRVISRRTKLFENYGDISSEILMLYQNLNKSPIVLTLEIYMEFKRKIDGINNFCSEFINGKIPLNDIIQLSSLLAEARDYKSSIVDVWIEKNFKVPFIATLADAEHLVKNNQHVVLTTIRSNSGIFDIETVRHLGHKDFVRKYLRIFSKRLNHLFDIISIKGNALHISFSNIRISGIKYSIPFSDFVRLFGYVLFDNIKKPDFTEIYHFFSIVESNENIYKLAGALEMAYGAYCKFIYSDERHQIYLKKGELYCTTLSIGAFSEKLVPHLASNKDITTLKLIFFNRLRWSKSEVTSDKELTQLMRNKP